jgi:hypothetical protein
LGCGSKPSSLGQFDCWHPLRACNLIHHTVDLFFLTSNCTRNTVYLNGWACGFSWQS